MESSKSQEETQILKNGGPQQHHIVDSFADLNDFKILLLHSILHPIESVRSNLPHLKMSFFGAKSFNPETDIPDLSGKVILVTGGNTGLGYESIKQLAAHNPSHIYLAARTPAKANAVLTTLKTAHPNTKITFLPLDLSSFDSITAAVKTFTSESSRLDILMNNAGIMAVPKGTTSSGFEIQMGTNHIGHALLTHLLLPTLLSTASLPSTSVRIINLSSEAHRIPRKPSPLFSLSELSSVSAWGRYGYSKLANILYARYLALKHPSLTVVSVHPGIIKTDLYLPNQEANFMTRWGLSVAGWARGTVQIGARNQLWACVAPVGKGEGEVRSGGFYTPVGKWSEGSRLARDEGLAWRLGEWTEARLKEKGF